jgi:carbon storage regulator CsrA
MLISNRKRGESITIANKVEVTILHIGTTRVRLGIKAPKDIPVRASVGPSLNFRPKQ